MSLANWILEYDGTRNTLPVGFGRYREMHEGSGKFDFNESNPTAQRVFLVDWNLFPLFVDDLLGYAFFPGGVGPTISRVVPDYHPLNIGYYADSCRVGPVGNSGRVGYNSIWDAARVEATYRPLDYSVVPDGYFCGSELNRFVSRKTATKGDYLQLAVNSFKWVTRAAVDGSPQPLAGNPGIIAPYRTLEYTWHKVPAYPFAASCPLNPSTTQPNPDTAKPWRCPVEKRIVSLLGRANSVTFDSIYPPGTVLFVAAEAELVMPNTGINTTSLNGGGLYHWRVKYYFQCKDHGEWAGHTPQRAGVNHVYDPLNSRWDLVTTDGTAGGTPIYLPGDLTQLFVPDA